MKTKRLGKSIYLVYSPDEDTYYFERRVPGEWVMSVNSWSTEDQAMKAYRKNKIKWEEW